MCCGFGGTFCVKYPEISDRMASDKAADIEATGADTLLAGDLGCLLNIAGKLSRRGGALRVRHVAEVLAGMTDAPAIGAKRRALMQATSRAFKENAHRALGDATLQQALGIMMRDGFAARRAKVVARLPEFEALRDEAKSLKDHVLDNLDFYLERFERNVLAQGGQVHWCRTAEEARAAVLAICRDAGARTVTKGKSMVGEEIAINEHLEANGIKPVETDLGEYIIQIRREPPSHIVAPAVHLAKEQVAESFRAKHRGLDPARPLDEPQQMIGEARAILRRQFLAAEVGITGANFLVAETGSSIIVTNEGNGDLTQTLPGVHIVLASIEKIVPTLEDATLLLRLLARSATGQEFSTYTTVSTGPRRPEDPDGPGAYHVILLDNGRSALLGSEMQDMLRCIRCAACLNHCPVYGAIGGHAYGWVYPGPMGAVLTPTLIGIEDGGPSSQRLDFLRPLRKRLPGENPAAEADAPLARARVRAASLAESRALGPGALGVPRAPPTPLSNAVGGRGAPPRMGRARARPLPRAALRRGLDARARHAGAGRSELHEPLGRAPAMSDARTEMLARIGGALRGGPVSGVAASELEARLAAHPRSLVPERAQKPRSRGAARALHRHGRGGGRDRGAGRARRGGAGRGGALSRRAQSPRPRGRHARPETRGPAVGKNGARAPQRRRRRRRSRRCQRLLRRHCRNRHADARLGPGEPDAQ